MALHLLSEREKDDLAQLVDTMVAYSITYKNSKPEPLEKILRHGTSADASPLFLDPPIDDFVKFKVFPYSNCLYLQFVSAYFDRLHLDSRAINLNILSFL